METYEIANVDQNNVIIEKMDRKNTREMLLDPQNVKKVGKGLMNFLTEKFVDVKAIKLGNMF